MGENDMDLLGLSFELTVLGILLAGTMATAYHRLDGAAVATICCFLALVCVCKLLFLPLRSSLKNLRVRALLMLICGVFSWWLIYQAEHTRTGWYRFHVIQKRSQQLISKAPAYVITADADGIITGASDNIEGLTGYRKEELVGNLIRMLMRSGPWRRHEVAFRDTIAVLRDDDHSPDAGWSLQGQRVLGIRRKDGSISPVRIYGCGVRWSTDVEFEGDIDTCAIFIPQPLDAGTRASFPPGTRLYQAPPPPPSPYLTPLPRRDVAVDRDDGTPLMSRPGSGGEVTGKRDKE